MHGIADADGVTSERGWVLEALAGLRDALVVVDRDGRIVYSNRAVAALVGRTEPPPPPSQWSEWFGLFLPDEETPFPWEDLPLVRALRGEEVKDVALFVRNRAAPQGVHILASANALRCPEGAIRGAACIFRDITLWRQSVVQLREAERQRKAILDNIPDMAWLKDREGRYLLVNQRFAEAAGRSSPEEVVGLTDLDIWQRELAEVYRADDETVMRTGEHKHKEEPFVDARGRSYVIETVKTRIVDDTGRVIGTTGIAHDITGRKQTEEALRSARDELERRVLERTRELAEAQEHLVRQERLAILGQLAGGVAHQIRNPLAAIMNATYVLRRHLSPDQHPNVEDALRIIHDEVRHANIIITGLLDYARVRTPNRQPTSLVELLERVLTSDWIPDNIRIVRHLPDPSSVVLDVDADQLQAAITNLVRNAVEAMPDGGELSVELEMHDGEVVIAISDTGTGISPHVKAHLFEPLHSTKPMGLGLGLVTARRFVEAHSGRIVSVDVEQGARFEIRLPAT